MRSVRRLAAVGLVLAPTALIGGPASAADSFSLTVDRSAWSWRSVAPAGLPVREPHLVPAGRLAVASHGDAEDPPAMATYLHLDLPQLPAGTAVDALTLSLPLDPEADQVDAGGVRLVACRLLAGFTSGEAVDPEQMPEHDCTSATDGEYDEAAGTWSFAVTDLGRAWVADPSSNHGVVVRPAPDYAAPADLPFQLVFSGPAEIRAQLTATPATAPLVAVTPVAPPATGLDSGFVSSPSMPGVSVGGLPPLVTEPALPAPLAAPELAAPVTAAPAVTLRQPAPALAQARTSPGAVLSLAGAVALLLLGVARVVGDTSGPLAYARAERMRLDRIRLRAPEAVAAVPAPPVVPLPAQLPQRRQGRRPIASATSSVT